MRFRSSLWFGFLLGFLFGTVGMWVLAMLSLAFQPMELISLPFFAFGRFVSGFMARDGSMGNGGVLFLILLNGVFYGVLGMIIQWALKKRNSRNQKTR